jgi:hypothetical protein
MQLDKQAVVDFIESEVGPDQAHEAAQQLPDQVDHEQHDALLRQFGVDPHDLAQRLRGAPDDGPTRRGGSAQVSRAPGTVNGTEDDYESGNEDGRTSPPA